MSELKPYLASEGSVTKSFGQSLSLTLISSGKGLSLQDSIEKSEIWIYLHTSFMIP